MEFLAQCVGERVSGGLHHHDFERCLPYSYRSFDVERGGSAVERYADVPGAAARYDLHTLGGVENERTHRQGVSRDRRNDTNVEGRLHNRASNGEIIGR